MSPRMWRRGRDSNPRCFRTPLFESGTINHSDTSPSRRIPKGRGAPAFGSIRTLAGLRRHLRGEELLRLVAADSAHDAQPPSERLVLRELDDGPGGAILAVRCREDERLD